MSNNQGESAGDDSFKQKLARFKSRESTTLGGENVPYIARIGNKSKKFGRSSNLDDHDNHSSRAKRSSGGKSADGGVELLDGSMHLLDEDDDLQNSRGSLHDRMSAYNNSISKLNTNAVLSPRYTQKKSADPNAMMQASFRKGLDQSASSLDNYGTGTSAGNKSFSDGPSEGEHDEHFHNSQSSQDKEITAPGTPGAPKSPEGNGSTEDARQTRRATIMDRISLFDAMSPSGFKKGRASEGLGMLSPRLLKKKDDTTKSLSAAVGGMPLMDEDEDEPKASSGKSSQSKSKKKTATTDTISSPKRITKPYEVSLAEGDSSDDSDYAIQDESAPKRVSKPYEIDIDRTPKESSRNDDPGATTKRASKPYEIDTAEEAPRRVSKPYEIPTESTPKISSKPYEIPTEATSPKRVSKPYEINTESNPKRVSKPYEINTEVTPTRVSKPYEIETELTPKRVSKPYEIDREPETTPRRASKPQEIQAEISVKRGSSKPYEIERAKPNKPYEIDTSKATNDSSEPTPKRAAKPYEIDTSGDTRSTHHVQSSTGSTPQRSQSIIKESAPPLPPTQPKGPAQSKLKKLSNQNASSKKVLPPSGLHKKEPGTQGMEESLQETVQKLKPPKRLARGDEDPEDRRNRLKATKSDLHDTRRALNRNKSGIARKTDNEEVRAPVWAKKLQTFVPPVFPKEHSEENLIRKALRRNFVFDGLDDADLETFVAAFEEIKVAKGEIIFKHGEKGDYFYIVARGKVKMGAKGVMVGTATEGNGFGELSLLYTCPRAASAVAVSDPTKLFRVDQQTFRVLMKKQTEELEESKRNLLNGISFLKHVNESDIFRLSNVMIPHRFDTGDVIVKKGEPGDAFYILESGQVRVTDISYGDAKYEDVELGPGDYFGERALATTEPRAANVVALSEGLAFSINGRIFERCVGNLTQIVQRAQDKQRLVRAFAGAWILLSFHASTVFSLASSFIVNRRASRCSEMHISPLTILTSSQISWMNNTSLQQKRYFEKEKKLLQGCISCEKERLRYPQRMDQGQRWLGKEVILVKKFFWLMHMARSERTASSRLSILQPQGKDSDVCLDSYL